MFVAPFSGVALLQAGWLPRRHSRPDCDSAGDFVSLCVASLIQVPFLSRSLSPALAPPPPSPSFSRSLANNYSFSQ